MPFPITPFLPLSDETQLSVCVQMPFQVFVWRHSLSVNELDSLCHHAGMETKMEAMCDKRTTERLSTQFMLHQLLGSEVSLTHTLTGRPQITGSDLQVSISHTLGAYALSLGIFPHGIDIEHPGTRALRLRQRFLHPNEMGIKLGHGWSAAEEATALWCAKEAAYKLFSDETIIHIGQIILRQDKQGGRLQAVAEKGEKKAATVNITCSDDLLIAACHP